MINAAIVGLGRWGQVLVRAVHGKSDRLRFVRGVTRTPSKAEAFSAETGIPVDSDYAALLADPEIDAVVLATPHSQHVGQIVEAAGAGKHIFCEKPLALEASGAAEAFDACDSAGVLLAVGQNRRFLPACLRLREMVTDGTLGTILHIEANFSGPSGYKHQSSTWRASDEESPAGGMTGKGLHMTDLMIDLLGPIAEVDARSIRQVLPAGLDDTTAMLFRFRDGGTGYLGTMTATPDDWRFQVYGSKGWAEVRRERVLTTSLLEGGTVTTETFDNSAMERAVLEAFADAMEGGSAFPVSREQAIANVALLQAIVRSAASAGPEPVTF
jgi:predicted dehydrogenase